MCGCPSVDRGSCSSSLIAQSARPKRRSRQGRALAELKSSRLRSQKQGFVALKAMNFRTSARSFSEFHLYFEINFRKYTYSPLEMTSCEFSSLSPSDCRIEGTRSELLVPRRNFTCHRPRPAPSRTILSPDQNGKQS